MFVFGCVINILADKPFVIPQTFPPGAYQSSI